jgi:dihydroxyacetone kinase-like predicted kinase
MTEAIERVHSIEIRNAAGQHDSRANTAADSSYVGLLEGEPVASAEDAWTILSRLLERVEADNTELVTVYYSENAAAELVTNIGRNLRSTYPQLEVETVPAGRLNSDFIVSLE